MTSRDDDDALAKLADLGLARSVSGSDYLVKQGSRAGTELYMAPEMFEKKPYSPRSDVFSLALVVFEMLSQGSPCQWRSETDDAKLFDLLPDGRAKQIAKSALKRKAEERPTTKDLRVYAHELSSADAEAAASDGPTGVAFYAYFVIQPPAIVTGHVRHRLDFAQRIKSIEDTLREKTDALFESNTYPLCLSDGNANFVRADLLSCPINTLVWFTTGWGWENTNNIQLNLMIDSLNAAPKLPRAIIVCMTYGAQSAARKLLETLPGLSSIVWITADHWDANTTHELVCDVVLPILSQVDTCGTAYSQQLEKSIADSLLSLGEKTQSGVDDRRCGVLTNKGVGHAPWTSPAKFAGSQNCFVSKCDVKSFNDSNLLGPSLRRLELWSSDLSSCSKLSETLIKNIENNDPQWLSVRAESLSANTYKRGRAICLEVCRSFLDKCRDLFQLVFRASSLSDIHALQIQLREIRHPHRVLLWVDLTTGAWSDRCTTSLEKVYLYNAQRMHCLITCEDQQCEDHDYLTALDEDIDIEDWKFSGADDSDIKVDDLHEDIKFSAENDEKQTVNLIYLIGAENLCRCISEALPAGNGSPVVAMYNDDDDGGFLIKLNICDIGFVQRLRDSVLAGDYERDLASHLKRYLDGRRLSITVDRSKFASMYESSILRLNKLTPHQTEKLEECRTKRRIHIRAPAGGGKTFIGLHLLHEFLEKETETGSVLFVARNSALCYFVVKWIWQRCAETRCRRNAQLVARVHVLFEPFEQGPRVVAVKKGLIETTAISDDDVSLYGIVIVDEAHHIYINDSRRNKIEQYIAPSSKLLLLSDISQTAARHVEYPPDLSEIALHEVVRCSERIVAGAMAWQLGGEDKALTKCRHGSVGPPLKTIVFDADKDKGKIQTYAEFVAYAIELLVATFPGLPFHDRLAIIVPDTNFRDALSPLLDRELQSTMPACHFRLVSAMEASAVAKPVGKKKTEGAEWLVLDSVENFDGLERLMVVAVGLDSVVENAAGSWKLEARSIIYRAITRAHMMVVVVNELLTGGWMEFLKGLTLEDEGFSRDREIEESNLSVVDYLAAENARQAALDAMGSLGEELNGFLAGTTSSWWVGRAVGAVTKPPIEAVLSVAKRIQHVRREALGSGLHESKHPAFSNFETQARKVEEMANSAVATSARDVYKRYANKSAGGSDSPAALVGRTLDVEGIGTCVVVSFNKKHSPFAHSTHTLRVAATDATTPAATQEVVLHRVKAGKPIGVSFLVLDDGAQIDGTADQRMTPPSPPTFSVPTLTLMSADALRSAAEQCNTTLELAEIVDAECNQADASFLRRCMERFDALAELKVTLSVAQTGLDRMCDTSTPAELCDAISHAKAAIADTVTKLPAAVIIECRALEARLAKVEVMARSIARKALQALPHATVATMSVADMKVVIARLDLAFLSNEFGAGTEIYQQQVDEFKAMASVRESLKGSLDDIVSLKSHVERSPPEDLCNAILRANEAISTASAAAETSTDIPELSSLRQHLEKFQSMVIAHVEEKLVVTQSKSMPFADEQPLEFLVKSTMDARELRGILDRIHSAMGSSRTRRILQNWFRVSAELRVSRVIKSELTSASELDALTSTEAELTAAADRIKRAAGFSRQLEVNVDLAAFELRRKEFEKLARAKKAAFTSARNQGVWDTAGNTHEPDTSAPKYNPYRPPAPPSVPELDITELEFDEESVPELEGDEEPIKVHVQTPEGKTHTLMVKPNDKVWDVKKSLADVENIPPGAQKLLHKGKQLDNSPTIGESSVKEGDTLYLFPDLASGWMPGMAGADMKGGALWFMPPAAAAPKKKWATVSTDHYMWSTWTGGRMAVNYGSGSAPPSAPKLAKQYDAPSTPDGAESSAWHQVWDPAWEQHYFFNTETNETTWEQPDGFLGDARADSIEFPPHLPRDSMDISFTERPSRRRADSIEFPRDSMELYGGSVRPARRREGMAASVGSGTEAALFFQH